MHATWDSETRILKINGRHKPYQHRRWTVSLRLENAEASETMLFRPMKPMTISDLEPLIAQHMDEFEAEHGLVTKASWIATAR